MRVFTPQYLYPIINLDLVDEPTLYLDQLIQAGIRFVQVRKKNIPDRDFLALTRSLVHDAAGRIEIIVNDRIDICKLSKASGVHLGQNDISPTVAREILGQDAVIGISTHTLSELESAQNEPVQYLGFGPVFPSSTKSGHASVLGTDNLKNAALLSSLPIVAIGGITKDNVHEVYKNLIRSVAVISDLEIAEERLSRIKLYQEAFVMCTASAL